MAARVIGIGDSTPKKKKTLTEAGYAQGQAGGNIPAGSQSIEPDVSFNQGEVLDNTNVESDQLLRGIMTRELFANTGHDVHE
jgi:hypothetical protein